MSEFYILEGHETREVKNLIEWAVQIEGMNRGVAEDTIGGARISTIFLGLNHALENGKPLLFETMVFGGQFDQEMERYSTWEEAEAGHKIMVERVKNA
jgi:hypothetical protein